MRPNHDERVSTILTASTTMVPIMDIEKLESVLEDEKVPWSLTLLGLSIPVMTALSNHNKRVAQFFSPQVPADPKPINGIFSKDVVIDDANKVWVRIFIPTQEEESSKEKLEDGGSGSSSIFNKKLFVIVAFHDGGFVHQRVDFRHYDQYYREVARSCPSVVVAVNYRLAPEFPYPNAYDDGFKAFEWLRSPHSRSELPTTMNVSQCFLLGESAGGNMVHVVGCRLAEKDMSPVKVQGWVKLHPFFGREKLNHAKINMKPPNITLEGSHAAWKAFLPTGENRDHPACNVVGPNSPNLSGLPLPSIFMAIGSLDFLKDWQVSYVKKLKELGKDVIAVGYVSGCHGFFFFPILNRYLAEKVMADAYDFIHSHML